jgi:hypothetical protein
MVWYAMRHPGKVFRMIDTDVSGSLDKREVADI